MDKVENNEIDGTFPTKPTSVTLMDVSGIEEVNVNVTNNDKLAEETNQEQTTDVSNEESMDIDIEHKKSKTDNNQPDVDYNSDATTNDNVVIKKKVRRLVDSDSDSENSAGGSGIDLNTKDNENKQTSDTPNVINKSTRQGIIDSDSDDQLEVEITAHNKSFEQVDSTIYTMNNKGELIPENKTHKSTISNLYDTESSDEERHYSGDEEFDKKFDEPKIEPKQYRRKTKKNAQGKKEITGREIAQLRKEIRSESQRMIRESNVSLPYHKPKSYTLKEFLEKRSKLKPVLPQTSAVASPAVAIKMPKEQLEFVSMQLEERIKEVEEFYKSESDSDDEETLCIEFKGWLDVLVNQAVDLAENKKIDETENKETTTKADENEVIATVMESNEPFNIDKAGEESIPTEEEPQISAKAKNKYELLKERLQNVQPRLSGGPNEVIDLEEGVSTPNEVKKLVERFMKHTAKYTPHKHKVELNIVSVAGGEIHKEKVAMEVDDEGSNQALETPGAKLKKLKEELQNQIAEKRSELWKHKQQLENENEEKCYDDDEYLDDEEEETEITDPSSEEETEVEEEDMIIEDKPKKKSAFIDEEANESDAEEEPVENYEEKDNDLGECEQEDAEETENNLSQDENENETDKDEQQKEIDEEENNGSKRKSLKRIIQLFTDDSDEDNIDDVDSQRIEESVNRKTEDKGKLDTSTASIESEDFPCNRTATSQRPLDAPNSDLEFLTPVSYLTGLHNISIDPRLRDFPDISPVKTQTDIFTLEDSSSKGPLVDCSQATQNTESDSQALSFLPKNTISILSNNDVPTTQELLAVCSGGFTGVTQVEPAQSQEIKNLDEEQDNIISQLLDEEELEVFKKKFDSPKTETRSKTVETAEEIHATGVIDSDDEGLELKKRSKNKKLVFSDDEDDDKQKEEEEVEESDNVEDDDDDENVEVDYDSEENEVPKKKLKVTDFVEKEAELSESDWGSEDEDEKGLDELEFELGDAEKFDENKVRQDLERIHMRQLLDEDNREVKLLQELYLEDGELHGTGRQRQFKWRNIDTFEDEENVPKEDDVYLDEEESEEKWRKQRHQREMFLKSQSQSKIIDDDLEIFSESKVLKIGHKAIQKAASQSTVLYEEEVDEVLVMKQSFNLQAKRGSFLNRSKEVLDRLAELTKVSTTTVVGGAKKSNRNFLFQTVEKGTKIMENSNKRKAEAGTPRTIKKLRLTDLSPANKNVQSKKSDRAKKLF